MFDPDRFISDRARAVDASGIRRVFDLAAKLKDPVNFSIGQPDFDVPPAVKQAAIAAIEKGMNRYTVTQGTRELNDRITNLITTEFPYWQPASSISNPKSPISNPKSQISNRSSSNSEPGTRNPELEVPNSEPGTRNPELEVPNSEPGTRNSELPFSTLITSGVSGGLVLALMTCVGPGDEVLIPDPGFVMYKHLVRLVGATPVPVDTYPDFQFTAARMETCITPRTRMILFNTPANPTGVVATQGTCREVVELADRHDLLLLSDEIYDEFCYEKVDRPGGSKKCPSPATFSDRILILRGFSKTYGMTGWRLGYAAGPAAIIEQMTKLQQYTFVCAPSMVQAAGVIALETDMSRHVAAYRQKRDTLLAALRPAYEITTPGGAFYAFPRVPPHLNLTGRQFVEQAITKNLLIIPGNVFSDRDTHFRISYACDEKTLERGINILLDLAKG